MVFRLLFLSLHCNALLVCFRALLSLLVLMLILLLVQSGYQLKVRRKEILHLNLKAAWWAEMGDRRERLFKLLV